MSQYFPKPYEPFGEDLSNYTAKTNSKNAAGIDTSKLAAKSDLPSWKSEAEKLHVDKLIPVPADLSKLSDAVKNDGIKKNCLW